MEGNKINLKIENLVFLMKTFSDQVAVKFTVSSQIAKISRLRALINNLETKTLKIL